MVLHNHAEDEFTRAVYGTSKFTRVALIAGEFTSRIVLEAGSEDALESQSQLLENAMNVAKQGMLGMGSNKWVDSGWLQWRYEQREVTDIYAGFEAAKQQSESQQQAKRNFTW